MTEQEREVANQLDKIQAEIANALWERLGEEGFDYANGYKQEREKRPELDRLFKQLSPEVIREWRDNKSREHDQRYEMLCKELNLPKATIEEKRRLLREITGDPDASLSM